MRGREWGGRGDLLVIEASPYFLVSRVRESDVKSKLVKISTGLWRGGSKRDRVLENIVTRETKEVHIVRMRPHVDLPLVVRAKV